MTMGSILCGGTPLPKVKLAGEIAGGRESAFFGDVVHWLRSGGKKAFSSLDAFVHQIFPDALTGPLTEQVGNLQPVEAEMFTDVVDGERFKQMLL